MASEQETRAQRTARLYTTLTELTAHLDIPEREVLSPPDYSIAYVDLDRTGDRTRLVARIGRTVPEFTFRDLTPTHTAEVEIPFWREHHFSPRPLDNGPLVLIETQMQGGFCIALNTGELTWGNKSVKQQHLVTSVLDPEVLQSIDLEVGEEFQFAQKAPDEEEYGPNDLHVLESTGPIKKILACSPLTTVKFNGETFEVEEKAVTDLGLTPDEVHLLLSNGEIDPSLRRFITILYGTRRGNEELNDASVVTARRNAFSTRIDKAEQFLLNQRLRVK